RAIQVIHTRRTADPEQTNVVFTLLDAIAGQEAAVFSVGSASSVEVIDSDRRINAEKRVTRQETGEPRYAKEAQAEGAPKVLHHEAPMSKVPPPKVGRRLAVQVMSRAVRPPADPVSVAESERGAVK